MKTDFFVYQLVAISLIFLGVGEGVSAQASTSTPSLAKKIAQVLEIPSAKGQQLPQAIRNFKFAGRPEVDVVNDLLRIASELTKGLDVDAIEDDLLSKVTVDIASRTRRKNPPDIATGYELSQVGNFMAAQAILLKKRGNEDHAATLTRAGLLLMALEPIDSPSSRLVIGVKRLSDFKKDALLPDNTVDSLSRLVNDWNQTKDGNFKMLLPLWRSVDGVGRVEQSMRAEQINQCISLLEKTFSNSMKTYGSQWDWANSLYMLSNHVKAKGNPVEIELVASLVREYGEHDNISKFAQTLIDQAGTMRNKPGRLILEEVEVDGKFVEKKQ